MEDFNVVIQQMDSHYATCLTEYEELVGKKNISYSENMKLNGGRIIRLETQIKVFSQLLSHQAETPDEFKKEIDNEIKEIKTALFNGHFLHGSTCLFTNLIVAVQIAAKADMLPLLEEFSKEVKKSIDLRLWLERPEPK